MKSKCESPPLEIFIACQVYDYYSSMPKHLVINDSLECQCNDQSPWLWQIIKRLFVPMVTHNRKP